MSAVITSSLLPAERAPRNNEEERLHRAVFRYLQWALPDDALAYHPANGGLRHNKVAARLVGLGVRAGVPDLAIVWRGRALFIELKAAHGVLSPHQRQMHHKLVFCGAAVMVCKSLGEVERSLRECGVTLRGSVAA
jgi:hypothetical protein